MSSGTQVDLDWCWDGYGTRRVERSTGERAEYWRGGRGVSHG